MTPAGSKEMFEAAAEPKEFWVVEGAEHQDLLRFDPRGYEDHVVRFLTHYLSAVALEQDGQVGSNRPRQPAP